MRKIREERELQESIIAEKEGMFTELFNRISKYESNQHEIDNLILNKKRLRNEKLQEVIDKKKIE